MINIVNNKRLVTPLDKQLRHEICPEKYKVLKLEVSCKIWRESLVIRERHSRLVGAEMPKGCMAGCTGVIYILAFLSILEREYEIYETFSWS